MCHAILCYSTLDFIHATFAAFVKLSSTHDSLNATSVLRLRVMMSKRVLDTCYTVRYKAHRCFDDQRQNILRREEHMNKGELIDKVAKDAKISKVQASNALN